MIQQKGKRENVNAVGYQSSHIIHYIFNYQKAKEPTTLIPLQMDQADLFVSIYVGAILKNIQPTHPYSANIPACFGGSPM